MYHGAGVDCKKLFYEVITDDEICYSFNMLDHTDILNDNIDDSYTDTNSSIYPERAVGSELLMSLEIWLNVYKKDMEFKCKGIFTRI